SNAINANFAHILCVLILITRIGDVLSTWLISPKLRLEANPIVRKLGWPFALLSLLACLVPYYDTGIGVTVFVMFALVCTANFSRMWRARAMGEFEVEASMRSLARKSTIASAMIPHLVGQAFLASVGGLLLWLSGSNPSWAYW